MSIYAKNHADRFSRFLLDRTGPVDRTGPEFRIAYVTLGGPMTIYAKNHADRFSSFLLDRTGPVDRTGPDRNFG